MKREEKDLKLLRIKEGYFTIEVKPSLFPEYWEKLEEKLADLFNKEGIAVDIHCSTTGTHKRNF